MVAGELDGVDEAEAGVGEVEVEAAGRQAELVVDRHRRRRLEVRPRHRGVDHHADLARAGSRPRPAPWRRPSPRRRRRSRPPATSAARRTPASFSSMPGSGVHALIGLGQPLVERRRGDHDRRLHGTDREHRGVDRPEACVTAHVVPSCPGMPLLPPRRPVLHHRVTAAYVRLSPARCKDSARAGGPSGAQIFRPRR